VQGDYDGDGKIDVAIRRAEQRMSGRKGHAVIIANIGGRAALFKSLSNTVKAQSFLRHR
jgi:hypothetical protein